MKVASTASASAIMIVWFTPSMIEGIACGICTFASICSGVAPKARAASIISGETWRIPRLVSRMMGGRA